MERASSDAASVHPPEPGSGWDCPCPTPFKDAAYCDDCPYREDKERPDRKPSLNNPPGSYNGWPNGWKW